MTREIRDPGTGAAEDRFSETRQQLVGGPKSSRVVFSVPKPRGYAVKIDGEFLRRSGNGYTSSPGWDALPKYVRNEGKRILDGRMEELEHSAHPVTDHRDKETR